MEKANAKTTRRGRKSIPIEQIPAFRQMLEREDLTFKEWEAREKPAGDLTSQMLAIHHRKLSLKGH